MSNQDKIILDLCGGTGSWSKPYKDAGYDVRVITIPEYDVREYEPPEEPVYGILAAPPCDQFSYAKTTGKPRQLKEAWSIVNACLNIIAKCQFNINGPYSKITPLKFWALENPYGLMRFFLGKPAYEFDPWEFGDNHQKRTQLWGHFNEPIKIYDKTYKERYKMPKFDKLKNSEIEPDYVGKLDRKARRSITPAKFAQAFYEKNK